MEKLVSVIIPTYKGANFLSRAIKTVINQTYHNIEIIVVDDNGIGTVSQKETELVIKEFDDNRIIYLKHKNNINGAAARNTGLKKAKGFFICFLDDDDLLLENRIFDAVSFLEKNEEYDGVFTNVACCDENLSITKVVKITHEGDCTKQLLLNEMFFGTGSNIFITKKAFDKVGFFNDKFVRHQDLEYMIRFYRFFKTGIVNKIEIIKSKNGINNIPKYDVLYKNEMLYNELFGNEIEMLSSEEKRMFFDNQNANLKTSKVTHSKLSFGSIKDFISLSSFNKLIVLIIKFKINKTHIFSFINKKRKEKKYSKIKKEIPKNVVSFLDKYRVKL